MIPHKAIFSSFRFPSVRLSICPPLHLKPDFPDNQAYLSPTKASLTSNMVSQTQNQAFQTTNQASKTLK